MQALCRIKHPIAHCAATSILIKSANRDPMLAVASMRGFGNGVGYMLAVA